MDRFIVLTRGQICVVDEEDYERLRVHKWQAHWSPTAKTFYAVRTSYQNGKRTIWMHKEVMGNPSSFIDHKDRDSLNNRHSNLRPATHAQNMRNRSVFRSSKSGIKGVYRYKNGWRAQIKLDKKNIRIGDYKTPEEAQRAYQEAAELYHGEFACGI